MKKLIVLISFLTLVSGSVKAEDADREPAGSNKVIKLVDPSGKEKSFSYDDYVIVPRRKKPLAPKPKPVVEPAPAPSPAPTPKVEPAKEPSKNRVAVFGGYGPSGFKTTVNSSNVTIDTDYDGLFGLGYTRQLDQRWSVEAIGLSNKTGLLGVGYSF